MEIPLKNVGSVPSSPEGSYRSNQMDRLFRLLMRRVSRICTKHSKKCGTKCPSTTARTSSITTTGTRGSWERYRHGTIMHVTSTRFGKDPPSHESRQFYKYPRRRFKCWSNGTGTWQHNNNSNNKQTTETPFNPTNSIT